MILVHVEVGKNTKIVAERNDIQLSYNLSDIIYASKGYATNKIKKTALKIQAFYVCFIKFCLALNNYKMKHIYRG